MPELRMLIGLIAILLILTPLSAFADDVPSFTTSKTGNFMPQAAFCERQTFRLENITEIPKWLDYLGGLRSGRTGAPSADCPSSTLRAIIGILSSQDAAAARDARIAFAASYVSSAMEPDSVGRTLDHSGNFRYLNDLTLASFLWLLCPGTGDARGDCIDGLLRQLPAHYLRTSPVFCDFTDLPLDATRTEAIEWPSGTVELPLLCSASGDSSSSGEGEVKEWLARIETSIPHG